MKKQNHNVGAILIAHKKQITNKTNIEQASKSARQPKGITLIALIITIIVLLILAGITIGALTGDNDILKNAQSASEQYKIAQGKERIELLLAESTMDKIIGNKDKTMQDIIEDLTGKEGITEVIPNEEDEKKATIITDEGYMYEITEDEEGKIEIEYIGESTEPIIRKIEVTAKNTNSISISVSTINAKGETYIYWYKQEGEEEYTKAEESKDTTYKYEGLEANIIYNIKVEIKGKDVAKEINVLTGELPQGEGIVKFTEPVWKNGQASVVITTEEEGYILQYQKNAVEDDGWTTITSGNTVTDLNHNDIVYARLWDGTNGGNHASTKIEDTNIPTVGLEITGTPIAGENGWYKSNVTVKITGTTDLTKGGPITKVTYALSGATTLAETTITNGGTIEISEEGSTTITAYAYTLATKSVEKTMTINIKYSNELANEVLKAGNYVKYTDGTGIQRLCAVLYDTEYNTKNNTNYGIQIITMENIESMAIGNTTGCTTSDCKDCFNKAKNSYNNAVINLNAKAEIYRNKLLADVGRVVGTLPNNPTYEVGNYTGSYSYLNTYGWNGAFKNSDTHYQTDLEQMQTLGIATFGSNYWLGSRKINPNDSGISLTMNWVDTSGTQTTIWLGSGYSSRLCCKL